MEVHVDCSLENIKQEEYNDEQNEINYCFISSCDFSYQRYYSSIENYSFN